MYRMLACLLVVCLAGCGHGMYPVDGVVQFDDGRAATELAGGMVSLQGLDRDISSQGEIHADGTFTISTHAEADGAYPGKYRVMVTQPPAPSENSRVVRVLDSIYSDSRKTPLEITVAAEHNHVTIRVARDKGPRK